MNTVIPAKKKAFLILACLWFIISFSVIQTTYAKYITNLDTGTNIAISYWNILVNSQDIIDNSDISGTMTAVFPENDYKKADVIVPGSTGYFDLNIDSSAVNVPFTVTVSTAINETSTLKDKLIITGYSINGQDIVELQDETSFTSTIGKDATSTIIRVYATWADDGAESKEDTALGISGGTAILDVNLKFDQIAN